MTLDVTDQRKLLAATGYTELGMFSDAEAELDAIDPDFRHLPVVLALRMEIHSKQHQWERMQGIAVRLMRLHPEDSQWVISYAYATRRAHSLESAKAILQGALLQYPKEPCIPYNLACYECQLGNLESAKLYLEDAIRLHPGFRDSALKDPDLKGLWDCLTAKPIES